MMFFIKFMFSKKATKIDEIFTVNLTVTTYCQIDGEDFINFCGLLRKQELYGNRIYLNIVNSNQFVVTIRDQIDAVIKTKYPGKK